MTKPLFLLSFLLVSVPAYAGPDIVGSYVGLSVVRNKQGTDTSPLSYDRNSSVEGITVQSRIQLSKLGPTIQLSSRPYLTFSPSSDSSLGSALGSSFTVDIPLSKVSTGSKANLYIGVGAQLGLTGGASIYQSATSSQFLLNAGIEGRLSRNLVGFVDVKLPFSRVEGSAYSPVMSTGVGIKF